MKSDHLFAVIIFNHIYIMFGDEIKRITKPQTSCLKILLLALSGFLRFLEKTWPDHFWTDKAPHYYNSSSGLSEAVLKDWPNSSQHIQTYVHTQKVGVEFIFIPSIQFLA